MIKRALSERIYEDLTTANKMVFISGPRQVGKTTLARTIGSDKFSGRYSYLNWDSREDRASILRGEFRADNVLVIFDEIHKYRQWKNYLKGEYDKYKERFKILVTGSARMDIYRKSLSINKILGPRASERAESQEREAAVSSVIRRCSETKLSDFAADRSQKAYLRSSSKGGDSLQGRYYNYLLHPLSINEVIGNRAKTTPFHEPDFKPSSKEAAEAFDALFRFGGFPEMFVKQSDRELRRWHNDRVDRLVKEDIRDVESLRDLSAIEVMVEMLPERAGSIFSLNSLCEDLRVTHRTVALWADVLEKFYYHFRIYPFRYSTIKSLRKEPKLYLWDWSQVKGEGGRFENMIASHLLKFCDYLRNSEGHKADLHYLRDVEKREVDFLVAVDGKPWLCAEAKLSKDAVAPALKYFSTKMKIPYIYQVLKEEGVDSIRDNIRTISASRFLTGLY